MDVGNVADVSQVHVASIFRVELSSVNQCSCIDFVPGRPTEGGWGMMLSGPIGIVEREMLLNGPITATEYTKKPLPAGVPCGHTSKCSRSAMLMWVEWRGRW
jgi:hypothetical protein